MTVAIQGSGMSRRRVLAGLGGLTFCLALGRERAFLVSEAQAATEAKITPWVRIGADNTIVILSAGAEMGQGSMTGLALILAEEMDADWSKVSVEFAPADKELYGYQFATNACLLQSPLSELGKCQPERMMLIVGSRATQLYYNDLRIAGAQVRKVLLQNAAQKWGVDVASLKTEPSLVVHPGSGRRLSFGEIAAFGTVPATLPSIDPKELKSRREFRLIGKSVPRRDVQAKVDGTAQYALDVRLPGMVYATALHSPVHDAKPDTWNDAQIKAMPGIVATVRLANGVAVVAEHFEQALAARAVLKVNWNKGQAQGFDSDRALRDEYPKVRDDAAASKETIESKGNTETAFAQAAKIYKMDYRSDLAYHAQMEPLNAVARFNEAGDHVEVWEGTQGPDGSRTAVAEALGFKEAQVTHHQCYMGGGFGRRSVGEYPAEAALIARAVKRPVKLIWTREEDLAQGRFRPQALQSLEAATDASGKVTGWRHCVVGDGGFLLHTGIKIPYYDVPNQHIERRVLSHGVYVYFWRGVGHLFNVFAIESLVDQMAADQGMDPIAFRLQRMGMNSKAKKAFETVAQMSNWTAKRPEGRALGVSITERSGSLGAGVVEISLDRTSGKIRVHKVWTAIDGGIIVQPEAAKNNVESGVVYGLSGVLHERVTIKDGVVEQSNFHDYPVMRMSDLPEEIHVSFVDVDTRPTGLGEIGTPFVGAAIGNAFYRLTGKRLTHLPFTPDRVLAALKA
jgi:isoquinoline 1-oxidoreductase beta subunit